MRTFFRALPAAALLILAAAAVGQQPAQKQPPQKQPGQTQPAQAEPLPETEWMPLKKGTSWTYKLDENTSVTTRVADHETVKLTEQNKPKVYTAAKLETVVNNKAQGTEYLIVKEDGIYRVKVNDVFVVPPVPVLKWKPEANDPTKKVPEDGMSWQVKSKVGKESISGTFTVKKGKEPYKQGETEHETFVVSSQDLESNGQKVALSLTFAKGIGIVKQEVKLLGATVNLALSKFTSPDVPGGTTP